MGSTKVDFASKEIFDTETTYLKNLNTITISLERNLRNENTEDMLIGRLRCLVTPLGQLMEYHTEKGEFPINFRSTFGRLPVDFRLTSGWLPVIDRELVFWIRKGFYCEGLTKKDVNSYPEIERFIDEGTKNRTVAATNMNATSSRAHTIGFDLLCSTCIGLQFIYFCAQLWVSMH